jgi:hypothetical protein
MLELAIAGLPILNESMPNILGPNMDHETYKLTIVKYFEFSKWFCIRTEDENRLK